MRPCSVALKNFLESDIPREVNIADLFTFIFSDDTQIRYSGWTSGLNMPTSAFQLDSWSFGPPLWHTNTFPDPGLASITTIMNSGQTWLPGTQATSPNGKATFVFQGDGNLVLIWNTNAIWDSGTAGSGATTLVMQGDGNLVLYAGAVVKFATGTVGNPGAYLRLADNGNLGVYPNSHWIFSLGPKFGRTQITVKAGIDATELELNIYPSDTDMIGSLTFINAVRTGQFEGARFELDRLFMPPTASGVADLSLGSLVWFYGYVSDTEVGRTRVRMTIKNPLNLLEITQYPRRLYMAQCSWVFGGPGCDFNRELGQNALGNSVGLGAVLVTATAGSNPGFLNITPPLSAEYIQGTVAGWTGANTGQKRTVANLGNGAQIGLFKVFRNNVAVGDIFRVTAGCAHTPEACNIRQNFARYGGFLHIPPPEYAF